ncbi:HEPN domain-containing protein [Marinomonas posidonica]|uniref:HEPN domain-containing protein n=1 Tax=Marinomonas posidonica TaxID=936476 RepID=UPI0037353900
MGSMSELMIEMQNERADEWIRERLEDADADEESEEYQELAIEYSNLQDYLAEKAEFEAELQWLKENGSSVIHKNFLEELEELKNIEEKTPTKRTYLINRMTYSYAVTLLEAFLGDTVKSLINENENFFTNSMQIEELKKAKYTLEELSKSEVNVKGLAVKELSNILYHNMPKVKRIFELIINKKIRIDISELDKIIKVRHDIVHRNGRTKEGELIHLSRDDILEMISHIEKFSKELQLFINENS